jgi:LDH2 family malate/lactate/ureidoglycolate dehydrogenase
MIVSESPRYRPDDLRRVATELLSRAGLARERASALGRLLLWYDAVGAHDFGIVGLGDWLTRLEHGDFDPKQSGRVGPEHASTAVLEAAGGLPPLLLARAAEIAGQKARDTGVGVVRVIGVPPSAGPAAAIAAELAIGPFLGLVLGPGSAQSAAIPAPEGVPLIFDSILGEVGSEDEREHLASDEPMKMVVDRVAPWLLLSGGQEVVVTALAVAAFESLGSFHRRVAEALEGRTAPAGWIFPETWERHRSEAQRRGIALAESVVGPLRERSARAGVGFPDPMA